MDGNNERCLADGRKECKHKERLKIYRRKSMPERGKCFSMEYATLSEPVAVDEKRLEAAAKNSVGEKGEQKDE